MGTFSASLRAIGDVKALPATIELTDGHLSIVAGSTEIGKWPLSEIRLEQIPTGYRMAAEGEQILLEIKDLDSFAAELENGSRKRFGRARRKEEKTSSRDEVATATVEAPPKQPVRTEAPAIETESATARPKQAKPSGGTGVFGAVDTLLIKAKKRFGAVLPDFMFSRAMFVIVIAVTVVMILLPAVFSTLLLIGGSLLVLFGAVVYSDGVLAARWLPGRATPQQALLLGLGVVLAGVLLGMIAK